MRTLSWTRHLELRPQVLGLFVLRRSTMPTKILKVHLLDPVTLRTVCNLAAGKLLYTSDLLHGSEGKVTCRRCIVISSRRDNPAVKETT